jgi:opacity protein-like surface antigen
MSENNNKRGIMNNMTSTMAGIAGLALILVTGAASATDSNRSPFSKLKPMTPIGASSQKDQAQNYLGASIGSIKANDFCSGLQECGNSDKSWKAFAGIRANENIVVEGSYVNLGKQQGQDTVGNTVSQNTTAFTVAGVAGFPMNDQIELFGKAGAARWSAKHTDSTGTTEDKGTNVLVGAGANYDLGDNLGLRAEWERFKDVGITTGQQGDIDLLSVGITFSSL